MILNIVSAFAAVISLAIVMNTPKKFLIPNGIVGATGLAVYLFSISKDFSISFACFLGAITIALVSYCFARAFKAPVTVFLIPGITPLVPGTYLYRSAYSIFIDEYRLAGNYVLQTLLIAGVIAIAILIMDSIFRIFQKR